VAEGAHEHDTDRFGDVQDVLGVGDELVRIVDFT
jgi:hypothetical protein